MSICRTENSQLIFDWHQVSWQDTYLYQQLHISLSIIKTSSDWPSMFLSEGILLVGLSYCCLWYCSRELHLRLRLCVYETAIFFEESELWLHGHYIIHNLDVTRWVFHAFKHFYCKFSIACWWSLCYFLTLAPWTWYCRGIYWMEDLSRTSKHIACEMD